MKHFVVNADFVDPPISAEEADLIFGPMDGHEEIAFTDENNLETLAVEARVFKSKGDARRNGFQGPAPRGLSWLGSKKPTKRFWVWNPAALVEPPTLRKNFDHTEKWFKEDL